MAKTFDAGDRVKWVETKAFSTIGPPPVRVRTGTIYFGTGAKGILAGRVVIDPDDGDSYVEVLTDVVEPITDHRVRMWQNWSS